ncbi:MAG: virulence RhuM family protein [Mangrovibacterium sp.]
MKEEQKGEIILYQAENGTTKIEVRLENENVWLTQAQLVELYQSSKSNISEHIKHIFEEGELSENSVVRKFRTTATDGKDYNTTYYNLDMIISLGYRIKSHIATKFRIWATERLKEYIVKGFTMDDERLKNGGTVLTNDYFERQLEKVREIRLSERKFYQKITDIYATALDYDSTATATKRFFSAVENKLHYAIHGKTAAEVIYNRADSQKENMGLTNWDGAPKGKVHKSDVSIAKNYLSDKELSQLQRIVSAYLDMAEVQAERHIPMTMEDWEKRLNGFLTLWDSEILKDNGKITAEIAKIAAETEFEKYRIVQDRLYESDFDSFLLSKNGGEA